MSTADTTEGSSSRTRRDRIPDGVDDGRATDVGRTTTVEVPTAPGRRDVVARQKQRFGGIKWGSAFFGWLTATGMAVLLTAPIAAAGTAIGLATNDGQLGAAVDQARQAAQDPSRAETVGVVGSVVLLVVLLVAYYCGGYVAGRMARFNGLRQGIAVWLWAVAVAVVVAIVGAVAGGQFDVLATLNGLPRLPINEGVLTTGGIIVALLALAVALVGALLGGLAGMRYHRKVDYAGFDD